MQSPFPPLTTAVKNLLIINVIFFLATWVFRSMGEDLRIPLSAFYFDSPNFRVWQPLTYLFMHADLTHLFVNMFGLVMFGSIIEQNLGFKRFVEYYFITGFGALVLHMLIQGIELYSAVGAFTTSGIDPSIIPDAGAVAKVHSIFSIPILGASGAIFGILLAFGYLFPNVEMMVMFIPMPVKAKYVVAGYMAIEIYSGIGRFAGDSVAHFAHIGGAIFGFILLKIWGYRSNKSMY